MKVLLFQLDGRLPNLALMRLAAHHIAAGDAVELRRTGKPTRNLWDDTDPPGKVYGSAIFEQTRPIAEKLRSAFPDAVIGGTGIDLKQTLEAIGVSPATRPDYSIYPTYPHSIGFTQRGCRLKCPFCVVPKKEGKMADAASVDDVWRGEPWPRNLVLLDNDFFGQPEWRQKVEAIKAGGFKVNFNQGINARFLTDEAAEAVAGMDYYDADFKRRRVYTAWDNRKDEGRLFDGLNRLVKYGIAPSAIMVYMLVGYWPWDDAADREYRRQKLRDFGCDPYPMPYVRTRELVGFQRWVVPGYDKRIAWADWVEAGYEPRNLAPRPESVVAP